VEISKAYERKYKKDMLKEIGAAISNTDWGRLLKAWIAGNNTATMDI